MEDHEQLAKRVLAWITCAERPLTTLELQHALAVEINESLLDEDNMPQVEDMVSVCAGLVTVDEESGGIIRLVHYTTQEYFERMQNVWFPEAQFDITAACTAYLSFKTFESGFAQSDEALTARLLSNPLYDYAAQNWGRHAYASSCRDTISFLKRQAAVEASSQVLLARKSDVADRDFIDQSSQQITGLHLAAYFDLEEAVETLCDEDDGYDVDVRNGKSCTPLSYAAWRGNETTAKLLLEKGADIEAKDDHHTTPLSLAAWYGREATVRLLLERGADIEARDKDGCTPLHYAVANRRESTIQLLLERGADIEATDDGGRTSLSLAAWYGYETTTRLLLEKGADTDAADEDCWTPLTYTAVRDHRATAHVLLENGAIAYHGGDIYFQIGFSSWALAKMAKCRILDFAYGRQMPYVAKSTQRKAKVSTATPEPSRGLRITPHIVINRVGVSSPNQAKAKIEEKMGFNDNVYVMISNSQRENP